MIHTKLLPSKWNSKWVFYYNLFSAVYSFFGALELAVRLNFRITIGVRVKILFLAIASVLWPYHSHEGHGSRYYIVSIKWSSFFFHLWRNRSVFHWLDPHFTCTLFHIGSNTKWAMNSRMRILNGGERRKIECIRNGVDLWLWHISWLDYI